MKFNLREDTMPSTENQAYRPKVIADDVLWGARAIAEFLGCSRERVYYLTTLGRLPWFKVGTGIICARKSKLIAFIEEQERKNSKGA